MRTLIAFLIFVSMSFGQEITKVGTATAKFLSVPLSPRGVAMGEAYTAVASDASSVFWNPAGSANIKGKSVFIGYTNWLVDTRIPAVAAIFDAGLYGKLGVFIGGVYSGGFQEYAIDRTGGVQKGDEFAYSALQLGVNYSRYFTDKFAAGVNLKFLYEDYGSYTLATLPDGGQPHPVAIGMAIDAGTYFWTGWRSLRIAMSLQNLGPDMKPSGTYNLNVMSGSELITEEREFRSCPIPMTFRIGAAMEVLEKADKKLTVAIEATHPNDNVETFSVGGEFSFKNMLFLRSGYVFGKDEGGFSAGFGVAHGNIQLDYSFSDFGALPDIHRVGITYKF